MRRAVAAGLALAALAFAWFAGLLVRFDVPRNVPGFAAAAAGCALAAWGAATDRRLPTAAGCATVALAFVGFLATRARWVVTLGLVAQVLMATGFAVAAWATWRGGLADRAAAAGLAVAAVAAALFAPVNLAEAPAFVLPGLVGTAGLAAAALGARRG